MSEIELPPFGIAHVLKDDTGDGLAEHDIAYLSRSGFFLDTCQRQIAVLAHTENPQPVLDRNMEWRTNRAAYSFLLQTATGLNSVIAGETNVLGQLKHGWAKWQATAAPADVAQLRHVMTRIFADSARIRQQHLQGIGGHSYGSLVRKLIRPGNASRILIVGAGDLAQSVQPYLQTFQPAIWNRSAITDLRFDDCRLFRPEQICAAADWATDICITTPADSSNDRNWFEQAQQARAEGNPVKTIVHLGLRKANRGIWNTASPALQFFDLDDVFALRSSQSTIRSLRVGYARKACQLHAAHVRFAAQDHFAAAIAQQA